MPTGLGPAPPAPGRAFTRSRQTQKRQVLTGIAGIGWTVVAGSGGQRPPEPDAPASLYPRGRQNQSFLRLTSEFIREYRKATFELASKVDFLLPVHLLSGRAKCLVWTTCWPNHAFWTRDVPYTIKLSNYQITRFKHEKHRYWEEAPEFTKSGLCGNPDLSGFSCRPAFRKCLERRPLQAAARKVSSGPVLPLQGRAWRYFLARRPTRFPQEIAQTFLDSWAGQESPN